MSFNGSGTFLINTAGQPVVSGTVISSTAFNALTADLATGLSTAITKDGQTTVTANIPMSTYKFTGLGVGSAATDSANLSQVQSTVTKLLNSVSGADTITATASPTLAAYAAGQMFYFVAAGDNTTSVTLNIDSLGAKAVTRDGSVALAAADIKSGEVIVVVYDGTRFQVVSQLNSAGDARFANVSIASSLYVGGVSTFVGNAGFSANVSIASALSVGGVAAITGATTIGGNLTLSGGTANGVAFLNASKVVTSGSALTFNGTTLVNTGPLKVGDGAASNTSRLMVNNATNTATGIQLFQDGIESWIMGMPANSAGLAWSASGAEQMRLNATGLGIGTTSPAQRLAVRSADNVSATNIARFESNNAAQAVLVRFASVLGDSGNTTFGTLTNHATIFAINNSEVARIDTSGNLGIGTASPGARLDVQGPAVTEASIRLTSLIDGTIATPRASSFSFRSGTTPSETARIASFNRFGNVNGGDLVFSTADSSNVLQTRASIDSSGNIVAGASAALATNATNGFLYVPTCAGTPTGTPTSITGMAPIVVNTTNNKLYFYSGGAWRDAGP